MNVNKRDAIRNVWAPLFLFLGDSIVVSVALLSSFWLRYSSASPLKSVGIELPPSYLADYLPMLGVGALLLILTFNYFNLYEASNFLRKLRSYSLIIKGLTFWCIAFLGVTLALKFDPPISRLFTLYSYFVCVLTMLLWRHLFYRMLIHSNRLSQALRDRAIIVGQNERLMDEMEASTNDPYHPLKIVGYLQTKDDSDAVVNNQIECLGAVEDLDTIVKSRAIQVVILADMKLPKELINEISKVCERNYVNLKLIPSVFEVLLSGLKMESIGSIPMMGIDGLSINSPFSRVLKRAFDVFGAIIGFTVFAPLLTVAAFVVWRESKENPFFVQKRIGATHKEFRMYKIRSMRSDFEELDNLHQSTQSDDPRLLRVGRIIRKWNIDEIPQFWNVFKGEMSLIGPRPERPYHVDQLSDRIPHYLPRHLAKPGMTGWAQVNGLRGNCSLEKRIEHDIYYIENWSLYFDFQILAMTFVRWKSPDE